MAPTNIIAQLDLHSHLTWGYENALYAGNDL